MSSNKKNDFSKMDEMISKLQLFGAQAAPAYNTSQRLTRSCMQFLGSKFTDKKEMIEHGLSSEDMIARICFLRHDHTPLESVLMIVDTYLGVKRLESLRSRLCREFTDEEILKITLNSNRNTVDYIKATIPVDVLISHLEGRALFRDGKSIEEFSKSVISIFHEIYPLNQKQLAA